MDKIPKVLFLSRGSASRAQMAEGFLRALGGDQFIALSAGTESAGVHPLAAEVMAEVGVDISTQRPRPVGSLFRETFRHAVVVCDEAREHYPLYPFAPKLSKWSVTDPETGNGAGETTKRAFREVRDQIRLRVEELISTIAQPAAVGASVRAKAA